MGGQLTVLGDSCYVGLEQSVILWAGFQEFSLHPVFTGHCFSLINLALLPLSEHQQGSVASVAARLGDRQLL